MPQITAETSAIAAIGTLATQISSDLQAGLATLSGAASGLLGSAWSGPAALSFAAGYDQWSRGSLQVLAGLDELADALHHASVAYDSTEQANAAAFAADQV